MLSIRQFEEDINKWMDALSENNTNGENVAVNNDDEVRHEDINNDVGPEDSASQMAASAKSA